MALGFDTKEDLRLRMADLEKKLTESEEERCKLEKTCNVLMRAFKEEEKMRYKALNKKYEKFLEDCTVRKRRNEIILRTLCRIEDRSKVLFAKTERLKLLKDRYVSPLKVNDRNDRNHKFQPSNGLLTIRQKTTIEVPSKTIQWKTPFPRYQVPEDPGVGGLLSAPRSPREMPFEVTNIGGGWRGKPEIQERDGGRMSDWNGFGNLSHRDDPPRIGRDNLNFQETILSLHESMPEGFSQKLRIDESGNRQIKTETCVSEMFNNTEDESGAGEKKETDVIGHRESIEVLKKMAGDGYLDSEIDCDGGHDSSDVIEKDRIEQNEKNPPNKSLDELMPVINNNFGIFSPERPTSEEEKQNTKNKEMETNGGCEEEKASLPKGLDGVDYENETYPESYYEQPTHHNHASIASDVILEEDETEQEDADNLVGSWLQSTERKTLNETDKSSEKQKQADDPDKGRIGGVGGRESGSEKSTEEAKTDRSDKVGRGKPNKSSLIQLLDSDTESFQIEHGDAISGNGDSEFDFSFGQN